MEQIVLDRSRKCRLCHKMIPKGTQAIKLVNEAGKAVAYSHVGRCPEPKTNDT